VLDYWDWDRVAGRGGWAYKSGEHVGQWRRMEGGRGRMFGQWRGLFSFCRLVEVAEVILVAYIEIIEVVSRSFPALISPCLRLLLLRPPPTLPHRPEPCLPLLLV